MFVGLAGKGTFNEYNTSSVNLTGETLYVGNSSTGVGVYNLGDTATLTANAIYLGSGGNGTFNQTGGTLNLTGHSMTFGSASGGVGTYLLSGGSVTMSTPFLGNVSGGAGVISVSGGTFTASGSIDGGYLSGSTGVFNVSGGAVSTAANLYDGYQANCLVNQTGGTFNVSGNADLAHSSSGATGTLNISSGTFNLLNATSVANIGDLGHGQALVSGTGNLIDAGG
jgi:hypothetical protein